MASSRREFLENAALTAAGFMAGKQIARNIGLSPTNEDVFDAIATRFRLEVGDYLEVADEAILRTPWQSSFIGLYLPNPREPFYLAWIELHSPKGVSYAVKRGQTRSDTLWEVDIETGNEALISPSPSLREVFRLPSIRNRILSVVANAPGDLSNSDWY